MRWIQTWPLKPSSVIKKIEDIRMNNRAHNNTKLNGAHYGNITILFDFVTTSINSCINKIEDIWMNNRAEECAESKSGR